MNTTFFNSLKAALIAGVPLRVGTSPSVRAGRLTLSKLEQMAKQAPATFPMRYRAAQTTFEQTGSMPQVMEGLLVRQNAEKTIAAIARKSMLYLALILAVALVGWLILFKTTIPGILGLRADFQFQADTDAPRFDPLAWAPTVMMVIAGLLAFLLVVTLLAGPRLIAAWFGGRSYVQNRVTHEAIKTILALKDSGMPTEEAIAIGCDLVGADRVVRRDVHSFCGETNEHESWDVTLRYLAVAANKKLAAFRTITPLVLVILLGGSIALLYGLMLFWPMVRLLKDIAEWGI